jgi:hypothetical protein
MPNLRTLVGPLLKREKLLAIVGVVVLSVASSAIWDATKATGGWALTLSVKLVSLGFQSVKEETYSRVGMHIIADPNTQIILIWLFVGFVFSGFFNEFLHNYNSKLLLELESSLLDDTERQKRLKYIQAQFKSSRLFALIGGPLLLGLSLLSFPGALRISYSNGVIYYLDRSEKIIAPHLTELERINLVVPA